MRLSMKVMNGFCCGGQCNFLLCYCKYWTFFIIKEAEEGALLGSLSRIFCVFSTEMTIGVLPTSFIFWNPGRKQRRATKVLCIGWHTYHKTSTNVNKMITYWVHQQVVCGVVKLLRWREARGIFSFCVSYQSFLRTCFPCPYTWTTFTWLIVWGLGQKMLKYFHDTFNLKALDARSYDNYLLQ